MLRRLAVLIWLLGGAAAYAESPDGTEIVPQVLWTREGFWSFCWPWDTANWNICLNNGFAAGGIGSRLVYAGGLVYTLGRDGNWWVWSPGWFRSATPPPQPPQPPQHELLQVGPNEAYQTVAAAVAKANSDTGSYYVIEIAAGAYVNDFSTVNRPMTIRAKGGPVVLRATVTPSNGKALIVANSDLEVDGLTFTGARNSTANGAGIRDHNIAPGGKLTVRNSLFVENDTGILTDNRATDLEILIEKSKFINNGVALTRNPHALYVNAGRLTVSGSLFCGQLRGHNIKSRASITSITGNEIYDGAAAPGCNQGTSGMAIDISNGGIALIRDNQIIQGPGSPNFALMSYAAEGLIYQDNRIVIEHNTFASPGTAHSTMLRDPTCTRNRPGSVITDNVLEHIRTPLDPATCRL